MTRSEFLTIVSKLEELIRYMPEGMASIYVKEFSHSIEIGNWQYSVNEDGTKELTELFTGEEEVL